MTRLAVVVMGASNRGKTTAIRRAADLLQAEHGWMRKKDWLCEFDAVGRRVDVRFLLERSGVLLGIESQGDPTATDRLQKSLDLFVREGCRFIVCASRTQGKICDIVGGLEDKGYRMEWLKVARAEPPFDHANGLLSQTIVELIESAAESQ